MFIAKSWISSEVGSLICLHCWRRTRSEKRIWHRTLFSQTSHFENTPRSRRFVHLCYYRSAERSPSREFETKPSVPKSRLFGECRTASIWLFTFIFLNYHGFPAEEHCAEPREIESRCCPHLHSFFRLQNSEGWSRKSVHPNRSFRRSPTTSRTLMVSGDLSRPPWLRLASLWLFATEVIWLIALKSDLVGCGPMGHPMQYLRMNGPNGGVNRCQYCGQRYKYVPKH